LGEDLDLKIFCQSDYSKINSLLNDCLKYIDETIDIINFIEDDSNYIKMINNQKPDLIFVNLEDKVINRFDTFKNLTYKPYIVFILEGKNIPYKILKFNRTNYFTADCILNPLNNEKIKNVLKRFYEHIKNNNLNKEKIKFNLDESIIYLDIRDIYYITTCEKYRLIKTKEGNYYSNKSLKYYEEKLKYYNFIRVHKSYVVNMNAVKKINKIGSRKYYIFFDDFQKKIKVGRSYIKKIVRL